MIKIWLAKGETENCGMGRRHYSNTSVYLMLLQSKQLYLLLKKSIIKIAVSVYTAQLLCLKLIGLFKVIA